MSGFIIPEKFATHSLQVSMVLTTIHNCHIVLFRFSVVETCKITFFSSSSILPQAISLHTKFIATGHVIIIYFNYNCCLLNVIAAINCTFVIRKNAELKWNT